MHHLVDAEDARRAGAANPEAAQAQALAQALGRHLRRGAANDKIRLRHLRAEGRGA